MGSAQFSTNDPDGKTRGIGRGGAISKIFPASRLFLIMRGGPISSWMQSRSERLFINRGKNGGGKIERVNVGPGPFAAKFIAFKLQYRRNLRAPIRGELLTGKGGGALSALRPGSGGKWSARKDAHDRWYFLPMKRRKDGDVGSEKQPLPTSCRKKLAANSEVARAYWVKRRSNTLSPASQGMGSSRQRPILSIKKPLGSLQTLG